MSLVLIVDCLCLRVRGVRARGNGSGHGVSSRLWLGSVETSVLRLVLVVLQLLVLLVLLLLLEVTVVFVCLMFPPAAVYHASKMHCHRNDHGSQQKACVTEGDAEEGEGAERRVKKLEEGRREGRQEEDGSKQM